MRTLPNINDIASDIVKIVGLNLKADDFSENVELVKQYLIMKGLELNDYDNCFDSELEGVNGKKQFDKAYAICEEYIVEYREENEVIVDRNEGLCFKDVE